MSGAGIPLRLIFWCWIPEFINSHKNIWTAIPAGLPKPCCDAGTDARTVAGVISGNIRVSTLRQCWDNARWIATCLLMPGQSSPLGQTPMQHVRHRESVAQQDRFTRCHHQTTNACGGLTGLSFIENLFQPPIFPQVAIKFIFKNI